MRLLSVLGIYVSPIKVPRNFETPKINGFALLIICFFFQETFQSVDRNGRGKIALEGLQEVLSTLVGKDFTTDTATWNKVLDVVNPVSMNR